MVWTHELGRYGIQGIFCEVRFTECMDMETQVILADSHLFVNSFERIWKRLATSGWRMVCRALSRTRRGGKCYKSFTTCLPFSPVEHFSILCLDTWRMLWGVAVLHTECVEVDIRRLYYLSDVYELIGGSPQLHFQLLTSLRKYLKDKRSKTIK